MPYPSSLPPPPHHSLPSGHQSDTSIPGRPTNHVPRDACSIYQLTNHIHLLGEEGGREEGERRGGIRLISVSDPTLKTNTRVYKSDSPVSVSGISIRYKGNRVIRLISTGKLLMVFAFRF